MRAKRASAASRSSRVVCRLAVTSSSRPVAVLETLQHRGELCLDRGELSLCRGELLLGGAACLAGFLHLVLGRRGPTGRGGRNQGDERGRDRDDAERHGEGVVRSGHV